MSTAYRPPLEAGKPHLCPSAEHGRNSGRTHRMLLDAIETTSQDKQPVWVVGRTESRCEDSLLPMATRICFGLEIGFEAKGSVLHLKAGGEVHFIGASYGPEMMRGTRVTFDRLFMDHEIHRHSL